MNLRLSEHLPLIANAPDGIQKLRGLILELAVRGKLVPQDPNDEPASELLKRVEQERSQLAARGICKKTKSQPPISEDQKLFALPDSWKWVSLGELLERLSNGYSGPQSKTPTPYPLTRIETISKSAVNFEKVGYCSSINEADVEKYSLKLGDILLSHINSDLHVGKTALYHQDRLLIHGVNLLLLRPFQLVSQRYIDLTINSHRLSGYFLKIAQHAIGQASINQAKLSAVPIALPPLAEQHRIVAKVDELMELCDRLEAEQSQSLTVHTQLVETLLDTLSDSADATDFEANWKRISEHFDTLFTTETSVEALEKSILQLAVMGKLFPQDSNDLPAARAIDLMAAERLKLEKSGVYRKSKPLTPVASEEMAFPLPAGWAWSRLGQIGDWGAGATPSRSNPKYYGGLIPWFKSGELTADFIDDSEEHVTADALNECSLRQNNAGDVLVAMYGATIGKTSILSKPATTNQAVCACTPYSGMLNRYLLLLLKALKPNFISQGAGGAQPNISREKIIATVFAMPPTDEQHRIVTKVDKLMVICSQMRSQLAESKTQKSRLADTLIQDALSTTTRQ